MLLWWLPGCVCVCFVSCISVAVDGVISEDSAVHVSTLRAQIMFRHSALFPWNLLFIIIDHQMIADTEAL